MPHMSLNSSYHCFFEEYKNSQPNKIGKKGRMERREREKDEEEAEVYISSFFRNESHYHGLSFGMNKLKGFCYV